MNKILLVGNVYTKIENRAIKIFGKDSEEAQFTLCVEDSGNKKDLINCIVRGNSAIFAGEAIKKGDLISVEGALRSKEVFLEDGSTILVNEVQIVKLHRLHNKAMLDGKN